MLRRTIVAAMAARTPAESRALIRSLPVDIRDVPSVLNGVDGITRSYVIRGRTFASRFVATGATTEAEGQEVTGSDTDASGDSWLTQLEDGSDVRSSIHGNSGAATRSRSDFGASLQLSHSEVNCEFEFDGVWFYDECATSEEVDEVIALAGSMDTEIMADWAEAQEDCTTKFGDPTCLDDYETFSGTIRSDEDGRGGSVGAVPSSWEDHGSSLADVGDGSCVVPSSATEIAGSIFRPRLDCVGEAISATAAIGRWIFAKQAAHRLMQGATKNSVTAVAFAVITGGLAAGYFTGSLLVCLDAH